MGREGPKVFKLSNSEVFKTILSDGKHISLCDFRQKTVLTIIEPLDTTLSNPWTVKRSIIQPLDGLTKYHRII